MVPGAGRGRHRELAVVDLVAAAIGGQRDVVFIGEHGPEPHRSAPHQPECSTARGERPQGEVHRTPYSWSGHGVSDVLDYLEWIVPSASTQR